MSTGISFDNAAPFEIMSAPFQVYRAPLGTAFPDVDVVPATPWVLIGTSGDLNYGPDGVSVQHAQSVNYWRSLGSAGVRKVFRASEDLTISLSVADMSLEMYRLAIESPTIVTVAGGVGTAGTKSIGLSRGLNVETFALLVKGPSPYGDDMASQYEIPMCCNGGEPEVVFRMDGPAMLALKFIALEDPSATDPRERMGRLVAQTDPGTLLARDAEPGAPDGAAPPAVKDDGYR
jgi:hypothetical protein